MANNLLSIIGRKGLSGKVSVGHSTRLWDDEHAKRKYPVSIIGQQFKSGEKTRLISGFKLIPFAKEQPTVSGDRAVAGSYVRQQVDNKSQLVLGAYQENGVWFVTTRTGLLVDDRGATNADTYRLAGDGTELVAHNTFSLDRASVSLESAQGLEIPEDAATRLRWSIKWASKDSKIGLPEYRHDLWAIPVGAEVLMRDIDGTLTRLIGGKGRLNVEDLTGNSAYTAIFEDLEAKRRAERGAERVRKAAGA